MFPVVNASWTRREVPHAPVKGYRDPAPIPPDPPKPRTVKRRVVRFREGQWLRLFVYSSGIIGQCLCQVILFFLLNRAVHSYLACAHFGLLLGIFTSFAVSNSQVEDVVVGTEGVGPG